MYQKGNAPNWEKKLKLQESTVVFYFFLKVILDFAPLWYISNWQLLKLDFDFHKGANDEKMPLICRQKLYIILLDFVPCINILVNCQVKKFYWCFLNHTLFSCAHELLFHYFRIIIRCGEACDGSGLCSSCNGEGFQLKTLSPEAAAKARANAQDAATRYTAG